MGSLSSLKSFLVLCIWKVLISTCHLVKPLVRIATVCVEYMSNFCFSVKKKKKRKNQEALILCVKITLYINHFIVYKALEPNH